MSIYVDADACPVKNQIEKVCKKMNKQLIYVVDYNHEIQTDYGQVITVDQGRDSVDLAIVNRMKALDVVITQDYGLASMVLSKRGFAMNQNGLEYTQFNIEGLLAQRHESSRKRRSQSKMPHHKKRNEEDNVIFEKAFEDMLIRIGK